MAHRFLKEFPSAYHFVFINYNQFRGAIQKLTGNQRLTPDKYTCMGACREISNCDTLIVAGTSLAVEPAASFLDYFKGRELVVINLEKTPADDRATLVLHENVAEAMDLLRI